MLLPWGGAVAGGPLPRRPPGHHGAHSGREHTVPADRRTVRPHPRAGPEADHLLVVPEEREGHMHVLVLVAGALSEFGWW